MSSLSNPSILASIMQTNLVPHEGLQLPRALYLNVDQQLSVLTSDIATINSTLTTFLPLTGGSMIGTIDMGGNSIINLDDPVNPQDAVTLHYLSTTTPTIKNDGSVAMVSSLNMANHNIINMSYPVLSTDGANKLYVDNTTNSIVSSVMSLVSSLYVSITTPGMAGNLSMSSYKIIELANPTNPTDATNKTYVDDLVNNSVTTNHNYLIDNYLPLSGSSMTGTIDMANNSIINIANPSDSSDAANKYYVDTAMSLAQSNAINSANATSASLYMPASNNSFNTNINMNSYNITNLLAPSSSADAANKSYVDSSISSASSTISSSVLSTVYSSIETTYAPLSSPTFLTAVSLGGNSIIDVADPINPTDCVTKQYIDTNFINKTNILTISNSTASTSISTGCAQFSGGIGVTGNSYIGGICNAQNGFVFPVYRTTNKLAISSPPSGLAVFDSDLNSLSIYNGTSWINLT